jgi:hypothetical protein
MLRQTTVCKRPFWVKLMDERKRFKTCLRIKYTFEIRWWNGFISCTFTRSHWGISTVYTLHVADPLISWWWACAHYTRKHVDKNKLARTFRSGTDKVICFLWLCNGYNARSQWARIDWQIKCHSVVVLALPLGLLGSLLPGLETWFHLCQLILSWNLSPRYFQLEGNEILLILALADICPSDPTLKFVPNTFSARGQWNFINFSSRWHLSLQNQGSVAKLNWIPLQHRRTKAISAFSWLHQLPSCPSPSNNIALGFGFGQLHRKKPYAHKPPAQVSAARIFWCARLWLWFWVWLRLWHSSLPASQKHVTNQKKLTILQSWMRAKKEHLVKTQNSKL